MTGTFMAQTDVQLHWDAVVVTVLGFRITAIDAGDDTLHSWSIRRQTQSGTSVATDIIACGGTTNDLCSSFLGQAYAQTLPNTIWQGPKMPVGHATLTLNDPDPGEPFVGPPESALLGLSIPDAFATWPTSGTSSTITWIDHDNDGPLGMTSNMTTSGKSSKCSGNLDYAPLPIPNSDFSASKIMVGSRARATLNGTINTCHKFSGPVTGPSSTSRPVFDGRIRDCVHSDNTTPCTAAEISELDKALNTSTQRVVNASFTMVRVPDDIDCTQVRACFNNDPAHCPVPLPL
jgi:hypothetical protein